MAPGLQYSINHTAQNTGSQPPQHQAPNNTGLKTSKTHRVIPEHVCGKGIHIKTSCRKRQKYEINNMLAVGS